MAPTAEAAVLSEKKDVPQIAILPMDVLSGPTSMLTPFVAQRIFAMAEERMAELDPERFTRNVMTRLWAGDKTILVLVLLETTGKLVGHLVCELCSDGAKKWLFASQLKADGNVGDAVKRSILILDEWAKTLTNFNPPGVECNILTMATHRNDAAWQRKYGLENHRSVLMREIGSPIGQTKE
jgi:hypothetical protein